MEPVLTPRAMFPSSRYIYGPQTVSAAGDHPLTTRRTCAERDYRVRPRTSISYRREHRARIFGELVENGKGFRKDHTYLLDLTDHPGGFKIGHSCRPEERAANLGPDYGEAVVLETWPVDFERAVLDGLSGSLGRLHASTLIPHTLESYVAVNALTAAGGVIYSLLTHPAQHGFDLLDPPVTCGHGRPVWNATEYQIPTLRGGVVTIWIVDGSSVPLIPMHTLNEMGVYFEDWYAEQECRPQFYTAPGAKRTLFHGVGSAVPLWRAVDGVLDSAEHRHITGADEIVSRLVWAAARAATIVEQERFGTHAYTALGSETPITASVQ